MSSCAAAQVPPPRRGIHVVVVLEGLHRMVEVTATHVWAKEVGSNLGSKSPAQIREMLSYKGGTTRKKEGSTRLAQALCPDPRALSTYTHIHDWLTHEEVDVLSRADEGKYHRNERDEKGRITNKPPFLWDKELPPHSSNWWAGGTREHEDSSDDETWLTDMTEKEKLRTSIGSRLGNDFAGRARRVKGLERILEIQTSPPGVTFLQTSCQFPPS